jgi:membrane peptidoglycan carboxypeptidase
MPSYYEPESLLFGYTLILEDRRFFSHIGIDYRSFIRNIFRFLTFQNYGGSSTIEMQLVRTITRRYEKSLSRKLYEILLAILCQFHFEKRDMLISYLSIAYFGTNYPVPHYPGEVANFEAVANDRYGKSPARLTNDEAAELASFLVYPIPRNETERWRTKVKRRKDYALWIGTRLEQRFYQK